MKTVLIAILSAMIGAISALLVYHTLEGQPSQVQQAVQPFRYVNYKPSQQSPNRYIPVHNPSFGSSVPSFTATATKVTPAVVNIHTYPKNLFFSSYGGSTGSGVIISEDGYIITNHHVIESDASSIEVTLSDQREYKATLVGSDPTTDLALLKITPDEPLLYINYADSDSVQIGEWVLAIGNPFNLSSTVTAGIISAKGRNINILQGDYKIESFLQTDAVVNPGNSGGALVNSQGGLIGINTAIITESGQYQGYSFAVPANLVRKVIDDLRIYGKVQRAILGVRISELSNVQARQAGMDTPEGVLIEGINDGSAAQQAGLQVRDIIVSINGQSVATVSELQERVAVYRPGDAIQVDFIRNKRKRQIEVILQGVHMPYFENQDLSGLKDKYEQKLGWRLEDIESLDLDDLPVEKGAIVTQLMNQSILSATGMQVGFIITGVSEVNNSEELRKIRNFTVDNTEDLLQYLDKIGNGTIVLEGMYRHSTEQWGYSFTLE